MPVAKSTLKVRPQQQLSDKKLKEILEEDKRRLTSLLATYRPITGENAPGLRFECVIEDFLKGKKLWLPVEMLKEKKFCAIIKCGSISAFCEKYMADLDQEKARDAVFRYLIRLRCKHDFYFFAYAYARIKNKDGGDDIPFLLNHAQIGLTKDFERQRLHGELHSILIILLKCRQWGGSTDTEVYMFWIQMFWKTNWNSNIIGHQSSSATQVFDMYEKLANAIPTWLYYEIGETFKEDSRKLRTSSTQNNIKYLIPRSCKIQTGSARNPESCRSADAAMAHITEEAFSLTLQSGLHRRLSMPQSRLSMLRDLTPSSCESLPLMVVRMSSMMNGCVPTLSTRTAIAFPSIPLTSFHGSTSRSISFLSSLSKKR